jgi:hypothetical protein
MLLTDQYLLRPFSLVKSENLRSPTLTLKLLRVGSPVRILTFTEYSTALFFIPFLLF